MHVFLTGERQVGKSVVIEKTLEMLNLPVYGFRTFFLDRHDAQKILYMLPAAHMRAPESGDAVTVFHDFKPQPLTDRFNDIGCRLLFEAKAHERGIIVMDECSRFEREATRLHEAIFDCLNGYMPVLGVVRQNAQGWVEGIRTHQKVRLITVTQDNRDALPQAVAKLLMEGIMIRG